MRRSIPHWPTQRSATHAGMPGKGAAPEAPRGPQPPGAVARNPLSLRSRALRRLRPHTTPPMHGIRSRRQTSSPETRSAVRQRNPTQPRCKTDTPTPPAGHEKSLRKTPQACTIYHETHPDQAVAFSSFFMIEKMKSADTRHSTIRMLHSTHRGRPPHSMPMMATM